MTACVPNKGISLHAMEEIVRAPLSGCNLFCITYLVKKTDSLVTMVMVISSDIHVKVCIMSVCASGVAQRILFDHFL